jgi:hypothetical protein
MTHPNRFIKVQHDSLSFGWKIAVGVSRIFLSGSVSAGRAACKGDAALAEVSTFNTLT